MWGYLKDLLSGEKKPNDYSNVRLPFTNFSAADSMQLHFRKRIYVADASFSAELREADEADAIKRFRLATRLHKPLYEALETVIRVEKQVSEPLYNVRIVINNENGIYAELIFLPNFDAPARIFELIDGDGPGDDLYLVGIRHSLHPVLQPICPFTFTAHYKIRRDDVIGFRQAICEIVHSRLQAAHEYRDQVDQWFHEDSEVIIPEYEPDD
jgi:hypothetical protein